MTFRRIAWVGAALVGGAVAGFVVANAIDYYRFHAAIHRLENLSDDQLRALGDAAAGVTSSTGGDGAAPGFEALRPIHSNLHPNSSDFLLYELKPTRSRRKEDHMPVYEGGDIYLYARISTSANNQQISYFTNSVGKQRDKVLWNRNPEFARKHSPSDRVLTVSQWGGDGRSWIVLKDRIVVIDEYAVVGSEPRVVGSSALDEAGLAHIRDAMGKLPPSIRGKNFNADYVSDGISLHIVFDPNGEDGPDDITIGNTWVEEIRPLLAAVSELSPKDCTITFVDYMNSPEFAQRKNRPATIRTQDEWDKFYWGEPSTPWWCVWRRWLD